MANISNHQVNGNTANQVNGDSPLSCAICDKQCAQRCSVCRKVAYCSKEHQKSDWKNHKPECFPATIKSNEIVGRHLVATRDIKIGEIIFKEKPLVAGPKNCVQNGQFIPICLACFRVVGKPYFCKSCKWPVCNAQCESAPDHRNNECGIFSRRNILPTQKILNEARAYEKIIIIRALLCKETQPKIWSRICDLESNTESRNEGPLGIIPAFMAVKFIQGLCGMQEYSIEEIDHIIGALETNVFGNDDSSVRPSSPFYRSSTYLYYFASMPAHDCQPNSVWSVHLNSEFHLKATVPISAGESITDIYSPVTIGTASRRKHLRETKYFDCSCKRCQDATELGTHFSSLKCTDCQDGYLVSAAPLDPNSQWICQPNLPSPGCGMVKPVSYVEDLTSTLLKETKAINNMHAGHDAASILKCIANLRLLVDKYYPKSFHGNHYLIFDIEITIIQKISFFFSAPSLAPALKDMSPANKLELSTMLVCLSKKCLGIANVILPGHTILRGRLLYFLQQGLTIKLFITCSKAENGKNTTNGLNEMTQARTELQELDSARQEAIKIFADALEGREEFSLRKLMMEPSDQLRCVQAKLNNCKQ